MLVSIWSAVSGVKATIRGAVNVDSLAKHHLVGNSVKEYHFPIAASLKNAGRNFSGNKSTVILEPDDSGILTASGQVKAKSLLNFIIMEAVDAFSEIYNEPGNPSNVIPVTRMNGRTGDQISHPRAVVTSSTLEPQHYWSK